MNVSTAKALVAGPSALLVDVGLGLESQAIDLFSRERDGTVLQVEVIDTANR